MKYLFIIFAILLLASCGSQKRPITNTVNTLDSTHVERTVRIRDTLIKIPFYKVAVEIPVKEISEKPVTKSNGTASIKIWKANDTIYADAKCDSLEIELQIRDELITTLRERLTNKETTLPPLEVKYVPWYIKILAWIGGISLLIIIGLILNKIYNPFSR